MGDGEPEACRQPTVKPTRGQVIRGACRAAHDGLTLAQMPPGSGSPAHHPSSHRIRPHPLPRGTLAGAQVWSSDEWEPLWPSVS